MSNTPKKWLAALLGFLIAPVAMLYVAQLRWAGIYFLANIAIAVIGGFYLSGSMLAGILQILFALVAATHAYRIARAYPEGLPRPAYSRWYGLCGVLAGFFIVAFGIRAFLAEPFRAPSSSMLPTIPVQAHLLVQKWGYGYYGTYGIPPLRAAISAPLARGDIIVFEFPPDRSISYVKRLIGLPGDKIEYRGKSLSINGKVLERRAAPDFHFQRTGAYLNSFVESVDGTSYAILLDKDIPASPQTAGSFPFQERCSYASESVTCVVPDGHYFTMGDNRDNSNDSRFWGFVPANHVIGKVIYIKP